MNRKLRVIAYTDVAGIGDAEISLGHLVVNVSDNIDVTVVGISQFVVDTIASKRPQASRIVLPEKGLQSAIAHWLTFCRLRPDIIHCNLCVPWACARLGSLCCDKCGQHELIGDNIHILAISWAIPK